MRPNFHPVDFHSFIGVTRKSTVAPPVPNLKVPFDSKGLHTHASLKGGMCGLHPARKGGKAHVRAKGTDENEKDETDTGVCVVAAMKKNQVKRDNR